MGIDIYIGTKSVRESNEFLRCLWAEMSKEFGKCGWHYAPYKDGQKQKIIFGFMDINQEKPLEVGVTYKEKGTINNIYFLYSHEGNEIVKGTELYNKLRKVIKVTKEGVGKLGLGIGNMAVHSYVPLRSYQGNNFAIDAMVNGKTKISCVVKAYDENQSRGYLRQKVSQIADFLSVETNAPFRSPKKPSMDEIISFQEESFQEDENFINDLSIKGDYLVISKEGKKFIDKITNIDQDLNPDLEIFLKACSHFHTARMQEEQMMDVGGGIIYTILGGNKVEIATTLYLSALEVVTLIGFTDEKCECCQQPKYQISSRVKQLTAKYLPKHLVKDFSDYYDKRSKYLHTGMKLVTETPTTSLVPLLDPDDKTGCDYPYKIPLENVREYVSFCLRKFYRENLIESS
ncbi:hypothetical protein [Priestia megaterium]|uniref:hypothetical protein n=1 Tax=Priestia megaterium TaxID=1404 RepID=UPI0032D99B2E